MSIKSFLTGILRVRINNYRRRAHRANLDLLRSRGLKIGRDCSFEDGVFLDPSHCYLIEIGDNVIFAPNVRLIAHDASTKFVVKYSRLDRIVIGSRCFLGDSVIILAGVQIGEDCIIGAGSVVTKSIPRGSVAAGIPAKVICTIDEYRVRHEAALKVATIFDANASAEKSTAEIRRKVLEATSRGPTYMP
jgi:maltose O-acetyltransferase